ncbi:hypothetical protein AB8B02_27890 [Tardiphaga sp. 862_B3_N4_1]|uniref:hypothetical protein n=1 Tax=Tardiphaga sp. 862_B3_N4_1 TaxID=3240764 RepID=UPI003F25C6C4
MLDRFSRWIEKRRASRQRMQTDARILIQEDEREAYYAAQRLAARSRAEGNLAEFWHWARVASEVARVSPVSEMNLEIVKAIADEEQNRVR